MLPQQIADRKVLSPRINGVFEIIPMTNALDAKRTWIETALEDGNLICLKGWQKPALILFTVVFSIRHTQNIQSPVLSPVPYNHHKIFPSLPLNA